MTSHSKNDSFGRKVFDELQLGTGFVSRQFHYHSGDVTDEHVANEKLKSSATTQLVSQIVLSGGRTLSYEYDAEERITKVTDSVDGVAEYVYDALGQLVSETVNGVVVNSMEYDNYGNILSKNGTVYTYGTSAWKDLLTGFGDKSISYDAQGNPTSYLGHTLTWEKGRQLKSFDGNTYTYNANGIRTSKTVDGIKHTYTLDGTKILRETWGENTLIPLYDNEDSVCGIDYNGEPYYFIRNLQGDVIAIVDRDSETVARYSYDAWGVPEIKSDLSECLIADINPFRYRGYYYDSEIGMYYLQSRYFSPNVARFINADESSSVNVRGGICDVNTYCYCRNNPTSFVDISGHFGTPIQWVFAAIGAVAGWFLGDYIAKKLGYYSGWKYWAIRAGVIIGGAVIGWFAAKLLTKILQGFLDTHKAIYNKLPRLAKKFLGLKCFVAGTLVLTPDGYRKIEEIEVGDTVLTYDFIHCRVVESNVLETYVSDAETLIHVFSGETEIVSSSGHRYYTSNRGWVQAQNLNKNDELLTEDGSICFVTDVILEKKDCPVRVYNLNVGTHHNYFVSASAILVHNLGCGDVATNSLKKISKSQIKKLGGEKITSVIKKQFGGSKANLYVGPNGDVYVSVNGSNIAQWVGTLETLAEMYLR